MHSPKFAAKAKILAATINATSLKKAWKTKVRNELRRQLIPDPVEFLDFHIEADASCASLAQEIDAGTYAPSHVTRLRVEKGNGLCRLVALPDIKDALILQVLADALWSVLRSKAPTQNAYYAPQDHAFLKMRKGLENDYGPIAEWLKFQNDILGFSGRKNYTVVTDIANYYDWIRYDILRNILSDRIDTKEVILDLLLFVLGSMIWHPDYMPGAEIGLPQSDFDAPRMLSHACLFEIDELLRDYPGVEFARYADDIDIGVDSYAAAKRVLRDLDLTLQSRHLRLNSGKTKILTAIQATDHFCVSENALLDRFEARMERHRRRGRRSRLPDRLLPMLMARWFNNGRFLRGNGLKIFKRLVGYSRVHGVAIDGETFFYAFINWPGVRDPLLRYISKRDDPIPYITRLSDALETGYIVDDVTWVKIAVAVVAARYTRRVPPAELARLTSKFNPTKPFQFFGLLWLTSRFNSPSALRRLIDNSSDVWRSERVLVRTVAGMAPVFRGERFYPAFIARTSRLGGRTAADVLDFYNASIFDGAGFSKVSQFVGKPNPSQATGITHSKFLMLLGFLSATGKTKSEKAKFLLKQVQLRRDLYYRYQIDARLRAIP